MRRALHDGSRGIAPSDRPVPTAATKAIPATRATTVMAAGRGASQPAVATRRPRQGPPRARPAAVAPSAAGTRSKGRGRLAGLLLGLLALILIIVAVVAISSPSSTEVRLRNVVYPEVQKAAAELRQLVSENTK
jgi:hypothetical protein